MKEFPPFRLDTVNQCLWRRRTKGANERILLTPKAFAVLHHLVERAGRLVTHDELLEAVWPNTHVQPQAIKKLVLDLRSAWGSAKEASFYRDSASPWVPVYRCRERGPYCSTGCSSRAGLRQTGRKRTRVGRAARLPWESVEGRAADRVHHRRAGHRQNRAGRGVPAPSGGSRHRVFGLRAANASRATAAKKPITRCLKRWASYAGAQVETRSLKYSPRRHQPGWSSFLRW